MADGITVIAPASGAGRYTLLDSEGMVDARAFGVNADGTNVKLSPTYASLAAATVDYPCLASGHGVVDNVADADNHWANLNTNSTWQVFVYNATTSGWLACGSGTA